MLGGCGKYITRCVKVINGSVDQFDNIKHGYYVHVMNKSLAEIQTLDEPSPALPCLTNSERVSILESIIATHAQKLIRYIDYHISAQLRSPDFDADDIASEVFTELWEKFHCKFDNYDDTKIGGLLMKLAKRKLVDTARSHNSIKRGSGKKPVPYFVEVNGEAKINSRVQQATLYAPDYSEIDRGEDASAEAVLSMLDHETRSVLRYCMEGLNYSEIGRRMGLTRKRVSIIVNKSAKNEYIQQLAKDVA